MPQGQDYHGLRVRSHAERLTNDVPCDPHNPPVCVEDDRHPIALVAQGLPRATENRFYAIWLYSSPSRAEFLGFPNPQPAQDGRMETGFALPETASNFRELVVTRETEEEPKQPGTIVLRGRLQSG